jgi:hypothetical protein
MDGPAPLEIASRIIREMAAEARLLDGNEPDAELAAVLRTVEQQLEGAFRLVAEALAEQLPAWSASPRAGYVAGTVDGSDVSLPWNLAPDFPWQSPAVLTDLVRLGTRLRATPGSAVCLSGSAAIHDAVGRVGDIDYCEYLDAAANDRRPESLVDALNVFAATTGEDLLSLRFKVLEWSPGATAVAAPLRRPWSDDFEVLRSQASHGLRAMSEYVAVTRSEGTVEVTNLVLVIRRPLATGRIRAPQFRAATLQGVH